MYVSGLCAWYPRVLYSPPNLHPILRSQGLAGVRFLGIWVHMPSLTLEKLYQIRQSRPGGSFRELPWGLSVLVLV